MLLLLLAGCGGAVEPTPVPPTPTPSPQDWLAAAVQTWNETESFRFQLALENRAIALDPDGALAFEEASGNVVAPDRLQATTLVQTVVGNVELSLIAIGDEQWLTNPLSGRWEPAPPSMQTEVAGMFDPESGIGALLADLDNLTREPDENLDGVPTVHLRGALPAPVLAGFVPELADQEQPVRVDLWIGAADNRIQRLIITEPPGDGKSGRWTFLFSEYNAAPPIEPPL